MTENPFLTRIRWLSIVLIASGACNIFLIAYGFYWISKEIHPRAYCERKPAAQTEQQHPLASEHANEEVIHFFKRLTTSQLISQLYNIKLVENGYSYRDLALGYLVTLHDFDLSRSLLGQDSPKQERKIAFGTSRKGLPVEITVYPGLSEAQYQSITSFATTERWPFTAHGLFLRLQKKMMNPSTAPIDPTLIDAFYLTPEFLAVELLFHRGEVSIDKQEVLQMLAQGNWTILQNFLDQQRIAQDLSPAKRQRILLDFIQQGSKKAAFIILKTDYDFALKKLDNGHVLSMLRLLNEKSPEAEKFTLQLLSSPRSDDIWQLAAARLFEYAGEPKPEKAIHHAALLRFAPTILPILQTPPAQVATIKSKAVAQAQAPVKTKEPEPKKPLTTAAPQQAVQAKAKVKETVREKGPVEAQGRALVYIVQDGDSLWKIAQRFRVNIDVLRSYNHLQSDALKPGNSIKIPQGSARA